MTERPGNGSSLEYANIAFNRWLTWVNSTPDTIEISSMIIIILTSENLFIKAAR